MQVHSPLPGWCCWPRVRLPFRRRARNLRPPTPAVSSQRALLNQYCVGCHNQRQKAAGATPIALDTLDVTKVGRRRRELGESRSQAPRRSDAAGRQAASGPGHSRRVRRPGSKASSTAPPRRHPNPGRTEPFHRLNRAEYRNAVRDLLDLDVDVASLLPGDDVSYGFDNIAGVMKLSPTLMDRYLAAAQKVSRLAVGTPAPLPNIDYFRVTDDLSQDDHLPGMPFGTRGGTRIRYTFPSDGEYDHPGPARARPQRRDARLRRAAATRGECRRRTGAGVHVAGRAAAGAARSAPPPGAQPEARPPQDEQPPAAAAAAHPPQAERPAQRQRGAAGSAGRVRRRQREQRNRADENWDVRVPVKAGQREVTVAFLKRSSAVDETVRLPFLRPYPAGNNIPETRMGAALRSVEISGPHDGARGRRHAEPAAHLRVPAGGDARRRRRARPVRPGNRVREDDPVDAGAARLPASRQRRRLAAAAGVLQRGPGAGRLRSRHRAGLEAAAGQPGVPVPRRARSAEPPAGHRLPHQRSRAGLAAVVLPLEQHPRRRAARRRREGPAARSGGARAPGAAHAGRSRGPRRSSRTSPASGCTCATCRDGAGRRASSRISTTACARRSAARPSCSSRASCARIAACSICCAPTTRSSTSGWRDTTASRTSRAASSGASR